MAWHPDRFEGEKQKSKAEDELKRINSARDLLKQHFQKEHRQNGPCACRPITSAGSAQPSTPSNQQARADGVYRSSSLSKQSLVTLGLAACSLVTVGVYFKIATGATSRQRAEPLERPVEPANARPDWPAATSSQQPQGAGSSPEKYAPEIDSILLERPPIVPMTTDRKHTHAPAGTFYASFLQRQEQRQREALLEKRGKIKQELETVQRFLSTAGSQLADLEHRLAPLNKEIGEHVEVMGELERVNSDLETPANNNQTSGSSQLYYSNPDYKSHGDRLMTISVQQKELQEATLRLKQQIELAKSRRKELESILSANE